MVAANPAGATSTDQLNFLTVGADTYFIEDDVVDVTGIGLPVLTATNYRSAVHRPRHAPRVGRTPGSPHGTPEPVELLRSLPTPASMARFRLTQWSRR